MTTSIPTVPAATDRRGGLSAPVAHVLQPILVAALVALVSSGTVFALIAGVFATGGGPLVFLLFPVAAAVLAVGLALVFRWLGVGSPWRAAIVTAVVVLVVYGALLFTGTQRPSIVSLGIEPMVAVVSVATGAASAILLRGGWRVLGVVGLLALVALTLTPVYVAL